MPGTSDITIAAKAAPDKRKLSDIKNSGLDAVELYLSETMMLDPEAAIRTCRDFPLRYAIHAPDNFYGPEKLAELAKGINAQVIVFHNVYWENEWEGLVSAFKDTKIRLCIENTSSVHEAQKFMRRYGVGRCLDLEHMQMECCGVYEEAFQTIIKEASHIHMTGYVYGSRMWHTHIHHSPEHNLRLLKLLIDSGYCGFVVSEANVPLQNYEEFKRLKEFDKTWREKLG